MKRVLQEKICKIKNVQHEKSPTRQKVQYEKSAKKWTAKKFEIKRLQYGKNKT